MATGLFVSCYQRGRKDVGRVNYRGSLPSHEAPLPADLVWTLNMIAGC